MKLTGYSATNDLARATTIPSSWYTDPSVLQLEKPKVFHHTWQPVGHARQVAEPGSYLAADIAGEPVLITRAADGELRAFSNVCRHRASVVASGCGKANVLRCPYHGWSYKLDGRLHAAPEFEGVADWNPAEVCLPQMKVEVWGPFVFVNADGKAPPLTEVFGSIPQEVAELGCPIDQLHFSARRDYVIHCNWKVYVDNYLEGYHLPAAHPSLHRMLDYSQYRVEPFRWYSSQYAPIRASQEKAVYFWIFPNFMLNVYPDNLSSNIIVPLSHDRTLTIFEWFTYPGADGPAEVKPETIAFSDEIQQEDIRICESVQRGLSSSFYDKGRFSVKRENGVHHFHLLLDEALR